MRGINALSWSVTAVSVGLLLCSGPVAAHHSFAAEFDATKPITLKGVLTSATLSNPHGWLHIDVADPSGKVVSWAVETGGQNALYRRGWKAADLPIGKVLIVDGFLAKDASPTMNAVAVTFEDGRRLFAGTSAPGAADAEGTPPPAPRK